MSDTGMKWYVLRTISGQEHKTKTYIENEMAYAGMSDLVGRIVIPMEKVVQGKRQSHYENENSRLHVCLTTLTGEGPHDKESTECGWIFI